MIPKQIIVEAKSNQVQAEVELKTFQCGLDLVNDRALGMKMENSQKEKYQQNGEYSKPKSH